ncbi:MAG TPA: hypothetical protein VMW54_02420 [Terriglobia bacterium]|nr:hypothetical protein [Terriglobia bacterium]
MDEKQVLDLVSAILASGMQSSKTNATPQGTAKGFFAVRKEIVKGMHENERGALPIYISREIPGRRSRKDI